MRQVLLVETGTVYVNGTASTANLFQGLKDHLIAGSPVPHGMVLFHVVLPHAVEETPPHPHQCVETRGSKSLGQQGHAHILHVGEICPCPESHHLAIPRIKWAKPGIEGIDPGVFIEPVGIPGCNNGRLGPNNIKGPLTNMKSDSPDDRPVPGKEIHHHHLVQHRTTQVPHCPAQTGFELLSVEVDPVRAGLAHGPCPVEGPVRLGQGAAYPAHTLNGIGQFRTKHGLKD